MPKVFLSAGHGGSDPGAVAYGMKEKDINLRILRACKYTLERHGVTVKCSRLSDVNDPVQDEVKEANASGCEIALSIHTNAGKGDGSESYYKPGSTQAKKLATLCEKYTKAIGQNSRGIKTKNLMFTRETKMPSVLVECAFIDNNTDNNIIDTEAERNKFGIAYAKAILEYFGITYKSEKKTTTTDNTIRVNSKVKIKSGAKYGGLSSTRGKKVPSSCIGVKYTVRDIETHKGVKEALLAELNSWVAVSSLTKC